MKTFTQCETIIISQCVKVQKFPLTFLLVQFGAVTAKIVSNENILGMQPFILSKWNIIEQN